MLNFVQGGIGASLRKKFSLTNVRNHTILTSTISDGLKEAEAMGYGPSKEMRRYNHLSGEIEGVYHEMSLKLGLSDSTMIVLYTLCDNGGSCPLRDICRRSGLSKQTVNSALRRLEAEGMAYLEPVSARSKRVCLTEAGQALADRTAGRIIRIENDIFAAWPRADVERYLELTERFLLALREKAGELSR